MAEEVGKCIVQEILSAADVRINGSRPWDIHVSDSRFYSRILSGGSLALGESYMDEWWDCEALDQLFDRILTAKLDRKVRSPRVFWASLMTMIRNPQSKSRAFEVGRRHYDTGNSLFRLMLDPWMNYSCGYWRQARTLEEAQEAKLELICRKLQLEPGMRVLDIGCGWGGFARYAAERFEVKVTGITVSREQVEFARKFCRGLPVEIEYSDYRDLNEKFDRVVSIGMFEHVGVRNYGTYLRVVQRCLEPGNLFLLQTIGGNQSVETLEPWIAKYIFPNSMLPSAGQITSAAEGWLVLEDWHCFANDYDRTLMAWYGNFTRNWNQLQDQYDRRFFRMWTYYLLSCAGSFRAGCNQLWQIVFSMEGIRGGYTSIR